MRSTSRRSPATTDLVDSGPAKLPAPAGRLLRGALLAAAAATFIALTACGTSGQKQGETVRLVIPVNATKLTDAGKPVPGIPDRIRGTVGDVLEVVNRDRSTQFVAGYPVSPGQTLTIPLNRAGQWKTECSVHEDESLEMVIRPREEP